MNIYMSTINVREKREKRQQQPQIFANRNTRFKKIPNMSRNSSADKHEHTHKNGSKFIIFKDRLAAYIEGQKNKEENNVNNFVFWNKPRTNTQMKKISKINDNNHETINNDQKQSILKYLRRSCNQGLQRHKTHQSQIGYKRGRIHTNNSKQIKKKNCTQLSIYWPQNGKTTSLAWIQRNHSVPVCTINYLSRKKQQNNNKTVYNSYIQEKFGFDELNFEGIKRKSQYNYVPLCIGKKKQNQNSQDVAIHQMQTSEVLIVNQNHKQDDYFMEKASKIINRNSKRSKNKKGPIINIGKINEIDNLVGPWSKMNEEEQGQHFSS